jgi:predicted nucleic acid-binding protein
VLCAELEDGYRLGEVLEPMLAEVVEPIEVPRVCRDPDDDEVLAAAVIGEAAFIVTGDEDLLVLKTHGEIRILTPAEFHRTLDP